MSKILALSLIISLLFSSCAHKALWSKKRYNESVKNFLISEDGKKLVVISQKYHYIFDIDKSLKQILLSKHKQNIIANFSTFELNKDRNINGSYYLKYELEKYFSEEEKITFDKNTNWLIKNGFKKHKDQFSTNKIIYTFQSQLTGKRYIANNITVPNNSFNKQYTIIIEEYEYTKDTREILSPVAYTVDGVLIVGGVALFIAAILLSDGQVSLSADFGRLGGESSSDYDQYDSNETKKD